mmetsp:Transcript_14198/g.10249  ORF Transcript_14198/g.10249 Transcript_14198/m.10249 type:complete len:279 (+) Transcript_14198:1896-2732(+)
MVFLLITPYMAFLAIFSVYTLNDFHAVTTINENEDNFRKSRILAILILLFCVYFLVIEGMQMFRSGFALYLRNPWNIIQSVVLILIFTAEMILLQNRFAPDLDPHETTNEEIIAVILADYRIRILYSLACILIWFRMLYFFRIFRGTGYYIRMVIEVISDLMNFMIIFAIVVLAFAHSFLILERNNSSGPLIPGMWDSLIISYMTPMGDYNTEFGDVQNWLSWIYFFLATFLLNIMLLNLLISIISDTFGRIKAQYDVIMYMDMLNVINENQFLYRGK